MKLLLQNRTETGGLGIFKIPTLSGDIQVFQIEVGRLRTRTHRKVPGVVQSVVENEKTGLVLVQ